MKDQNKTKKQLIIELMELRHRITELEALEKERKQLEYTARENGERLRLLADSLPVLISYVDSEQRYRFNSYAYERWFGQSPTEICGMYIKDVLGEAAYQAIQQYVKAALSGQEVTYEREVPYQYGGTRYISGSYIPHFGDQGEVKGIFALVNDITEQKRIEEELRKHRDRLEDLVEEQTAGLRRTVEELKREANERKRTEKKLQESEKLLRTFVNAINESVFVIDTEGIVIISNETSAQRLGTNVNELMGTCIYHYLPPEIARDRKSEVDKVIRTGKSSAFEDLRAGAWINSFVYPIFDEEGKVVNVGFIAVDITERKRAEATLQKNLTLYQGLIETTDTGFVILDQEGKVLDANQEYVHLSGHEDLSQIRGRSVVEWTAHYEKERNAKAVGKCFREGQIRNLEIDYVNAQGKITPIEINATVVKVDGASQILTLCRDITERKRVEEKLKKSEFLLKEAQRVASIGHWELDPAVGTPTWSEEIFHIFGLDPAQGEPSFKDHQKIIHPDDWNILNNAVTIASAEGVPFDIEFRLLRPDRSIRWMNAKGYSIKDSEGHIVRIFGTAQDITERKRVEEALRRKSEEQDLLLNNIQTQVWYLTDKETYGAVNKARAKFFGKKNEEMENRRFYDVLSKDEADICMSGYVEVFKKRKQIHTEEWITNAKGEKRLLSIIKSPKLNENGDVEYIVCSAEDITERKRAEDGIKKLNEELERRVIERTTQLEATNEELKFLLNIHSQTEEELMKYEKRLEELVERRTERIRELERQRTEIEKLAAAGLMAARIAHEINNPLAGIKNSFSLVKDAVPEDHPYYAYVGRIDNEINRVARIVRQMFDVYRPEQEIKKEFSIDKTIYEVVALLETAWQENNITIEIDSKPITMEMPEGLLRQVLYNILVNAIEASPQGSVVKIMTEVNNEILTLLVSDQGVGIPLEVQPRIFEPFFTSKEGSQKGLGLGLAVSKDIVEKLGGHIDFESEPGKGTLFRIILPLKSGERR